MQTQMNLMQTQMKAYPVVDSVIDMFAGWLKHRRDVVSVCDCDDSGYQRIARDLGVSCEELDDLVRRGPHAADELPKMMAALNLDLAAVKRAEPLVLRDMERVCSQCDHKRRCDHDLANGTAAQNHAEYCGNAPTLAALTK
jgi:uncharacterized protein DUF6455